MQGGRTPAAILDALGEPMRRLILARLRRQPSSVTALAKGMPITRSAVSRHLQVLSGAGLVEAEPAGRERIYRAHPAGLAPLRAWIAEVMSGAP